MHGLFGSQTRFLSGSSITFIIGIPLHFEFVNLMLTKYTLFLQLLDLLRPLTRTNQLIMIEVMIKVFILLAVCIMAFGFVFASSKTAQDHEWVCPVALATNGGCMMPKDSAAGAAWHINVLVVLFAGIVAATFNIGFRAIIRLFETIFVFLHPPRLLTQYRYFFIKRLRIIRHLFSELDKWLSDGVYLHRVANAVA